MAEESQTLLHRLHATFISLRNPNFRIYFVAQALSNVGTWIQITAENWLILELTNSGWARGVTNALQFGPLVFLGLYGGVIADRFDRRRLLIVSQSALAILSAAIGLLVIADLIQLWIIWLAALLLGLVICLDRPVLSSFIKDLVGETDLSNAVALNNALISLGRMVGPVVSGFLIACFGMAPSFFVNAISFGIVVVVLIMLDAAGLHAPRPVERKPGQVREGLSYIRQDRVLRLTVMAMSVIFIAAYNLQVMVPLVASRMLDGLSELLGILMSSLGLGAVTGSLIIASWVRPGLMMLAVCCGMLSIAHVWLALPLGIYFSVAGMFLLGISCGCFNVTVTSTLQVRARDDVRGRVMSTYSIGILGSALVGAPLAGILADTLGLPATFLVIAAICACTGLAITSAQMSAATRRVSVRRKTRHCRKTRGAPKPNNGTRTIRPCGLRSALPPKAGGSCRLIPHHYYSRLFAHERAHDEGRMSHSDDVSIRRFREPDLCQLVRLISETIGISYAGVYPPRAVQFFKDFHSEKKIADRSKTDTTLVVEEDGELVATGGLVHGEILAVFVHPRLQKGGRGKALMKALENEAGASGVTEIGLSISLPSKRFYESLGYKVVEEISRDVGEGQRLDFWKAVKQLPKS